MLRYDILFSPLLFLLILRLTLYSSFLSFDDHFSHLSFLHFAGLRQHLLLHLVAGVFDDDFACAT